MRIALMAISGFVLSLAIQANQLGVAYAAGPPPVNLGSAGGFAILSKTGVTNVSASAITGDVGASPITGAAILLTCSEVVGTIYSVDAAGPMPCRITNATKLSTAVSDMQTAYTDAAAARPNTVTELGAGNIGGRILAPGVYKWSSNVTIPADVTFSGRAQDVWILQIAGDLQLANARKVLLRGGAQPRNIYWQVGGQATLGTTSQFNGTILSETSIAMNTGATINGRLLAQTAVTLQQNVVKRP
ncbi:MAG: ice-binding family protein [Planctomycetaceae bacterium]|nr:ice-binding family protein [Planctomycetaceae bacterium]